MKVAYILLSAAGTLALILDSEHVCSLSNCNIEDVKGLDADDC